MGGRPKNKDLRPREYLTQAEVERLLKATKKSRFPSVYYALVIVMYRHGYRVSELINLKWHHVDLENENIQVVRSKNGIDRNQPLGKKEVRALKKLKNKRGKSPYVFISMQKMPFSRSAIQKIIKKLGEDAEFDFPIHPHMLRHGTGYKLINDGENLRVTQAYLGHRNIQNTEKYTALNNKAFDHFPEKIWGD